MEVGVQLVVESTIFRIVGPENDAEEVVVVVVVVEAARNAFFPTTSVLVFPMVEFFSSSSSSSLPPARWTLRSLKRFLPVIDFMFFFG